MQLNPDPKYAELRTMCSRFLSNKISDAPDKDDLLTLVDYAMDVNELSSAWIIIAIAARFYPADDDFAVKTAYLAFVEGDNVYARKSVESADVEPLLADATRLLVTSRDNPEQLDREIERVVMGYDYIHEEALFSILTAALDHDSYDVIKRLLPEIEKRCNNTIDFYLDVERWAEQKEDREFAALLLERMTEKWPMDGEVWERYASFNLTINNFTECINGAEYALAINPDDAEASLLRHQAKIMLAYEAMATDDLVEEAVLALKDLDRMKDGAGYGEVLGWLVSITGGVSVPGLYEHLLDYNRNNPTDKAVLNSLLRFAELSREFEIQEFLVKEFYAASDDNTEGDWAVWSQQLRADMLLHASRTVMAVYYELAGVDGSNCDDLCAWLESCYLRRRFVDILKFNMLDCPRYKMLPPDALRAPWAFAMMFRVLSYARLGQKSHILSFPGLFDLFPEGDFWLSGVVLLTSVRGVVDTFNSVRRWAADPSSTVADLNAVDPLSRLFCAYEDAGE